MKILILYDYYAPIPLRQSQKDLLFSFKKYSKHNVFYCNYSYGIPWYIKMSSFDLILIHASVTGLLRWNGLSFDAYTSRMKYLKNIDTPRAIFCQDEFYKTDMLVQLVNEFNVDVVFTVAEEEEWQNIYRGVDFEAVRFKKVLTGYLDDQIELTMQSLAQEKISRDIDIGYRASHVPPYLGSRGQLKIDVGKKIKSSAEARGLKTDIKTINDEKEMFHGLDWYRFLLKCKGTVGVEGGSSIIDREGNLSKIVDRYLKENPDSDYATVEKACFDGFDGNLNLVALSPRHLEACATKTCQILIEGDYSDVLKPGIHYIELKKDFSNIEHVIDEFLDDQRREEMTERAYKDIVLSRKYFTSSFVDDVFDTMEKYVKRKSSGSISFIFRAIYKMKESWDLRRAAFEINLFRKIKWLIPTSLLIKLKKMRNRST